MRHDVRAVALAWVATGVGVIGLPYLIVTEGTVGLLSAVVVSLVFRFGRMWLNQQWIDRQTVRGTKFAVGEDAMVIIESERVTGAAFGSSTSGDLLVMLNCEAGEVPEVRDGMLRRAEIWVRDNEQRSIRFVDWVYTVLVYVLAGGAFVVFGGFESGLIWATGTVAHFLAVLAYLTDIEKQAGTKIVGAGPEVWEACRMWFVRHRSGSAMTGPVWAGDLFAKRYVPFPAASGDDRGRHGLLVGLQHAAIMAKASVRRGRASSPSVRPADEAD